MAAANTRRITSIRHPSLSPDNELTVTYEPPAPGESTGGRSGKQRVPTAVLLTDLVQDFQSMARELEAVKAELAELKGNPSPAPSPEPPIDGAILKGISYDEHGPSQPTFTYRHKC